MELKIQRFDELTVNELYEILSAREEIFTIEKGMVCRDVDGLDREALHCSLKDGENLLAYLRVLPFGESVKIGRVITLSHGKGHGRILFDSLFPALSDMLGVKKITVHAQKDAVGFYKKMGFTVTSDEFIEAGVIHLAMEKDL